MSRPHIRRWPLFGALFVLATLVLGCGVGGVTANTTPRWACPSPLPKPYGPGGPVKDVRQHCDTDPTTGVTTCRDENVYYEEWEQEYGSLGGPPFPSPTPYGFSSRSFIFGQRVEVAPLHVQVTASAGAVVVRDAVAPNTQQLYRITLTWTNPTGDAIPIDYARQVRLRAVTAPNGAVVTAATWSMNVAALRAAGSQEPPSAIAVGESTVTIPIIGPFGQPKTVEVQFARDATATTPTSAAVATPTAGGNDDLRRTDDQSLIVQWTNSGFDYNGAPPCNDAGALTDWGGGPKPVNVPAAPPGTDRVVQIALGQVGKTYIWGAKGPETFDCSGLMTWSYAQIGIAIPQGTAGQWPRMRPVDGSQLKSDARRPAPGRHRGSASPLPAQRERHAYRRIARGGKDR